METIKNLGVQVAVDDVGGGFSSLDIVAGVKPQFVKIDMSLIREIHSDMLKQNIVESIIHFCKKSNILTIAEGRELLTEIH